MTHEEWIERFSARYSRLTGVGFDLARQVAAHALEGGGPHGEAQNLYRDPVEMAEELEAEDSSDDAPAIREGNSR